MENGHNRLSAEKELSRVYDVLISLFTDAQSKCENISKLLTGLASGALVLSLSFMSRKYICSRFILLLSWIFLLISILVGIGVLYKIYKLHRNRCSELKKLAQDVETRVESSHAEGMLTFRRYIIRTNKYGNAF